jgi:hypothetical protein
VHTNNLFEINQFSNESNPYLSAAKHILHNYDFGKDYGFVASFEWVVGSEPISGRGFIAANVFLSVKGDVPELKKYNSGGLVDACFTTWIDEDSKFIGERGTTLRVVHESKVIPEIQAIGKCNKESLNYAINLLDKETMATSNRIIKNIMSRSYKAA